MRQVSVTAPRTSPGGIHPLDTTEQESLNLLDPPENQLTLVDSATSTCEGMHPGCGIPDGSAESGTASLGYTPLMARYRRLHEYM